MRVLGLIPARGGSKAIPLKNIAMIAGKPLIAHTVAVAKSSRCLARVVVSTDDQAIADVATACGADVPFMRPSYLSTDEATSVDVAIHALEAVETEEGALYDYLCLLEPTSPLRVSEDVEGAVALALDNLADAVVSVCRVEAPHPVKTLTISEGRLQPFLPALWRPNLRRQELTPVYAVNGAVYCVSRRALVESRSFWASGALAYVMPEERSVNIDTPKDLAFAEFLMNTRSSSSRQR